MTKSFDELLLDAGWFCSLADNSPENSRAGVRYSTASILVSFAAIEAFINGMMSDFSSLPQGLFTPHEQGFLAEKVVELSDSGAAAGRFQVTERGQYRSLEAKIMFLVARFSDTAVDKGSTLWQRFEQAKDVRDNLTHPRKDIDNTPSEADAQLILQVAKDIIQLTAQHVWGKHLVF